MEDVPLELPLDPLLVLVAVAHEARGLARPLGLERTPVGYQGRGLLLVPAGLRASALPRLEPSLLRLGPRAVLISGLAGGLAPELEPGDLVVGSTVARAGGARVPVVPDPTLQDRAIKALEAARLTFRVGPLLTVPDPVGAPEEKARLWRDSGALAVDMESAPLLGWAVRQGLPAVVVRGVADGPRDALPPALLDLIASDGRLRPGALLGLLAQPARLSRALALARRSRLALSGLAAFLTSFTSLRP